MAGAGQPWYMPLTVRHDADEAMFLFAAEC